MCVRILPSNNEHAFDDNCRREASAPSLEVFGAPPNTLKHNAERHCCGKMEALPYGLEVSGEGAGPTLLDPASPLFLPAPS